MKYKDSNKSIILIQTAFYPEAQPIIEYYKLKKFIGDYAYDIYRNKEESVFLVISGIGKIKAAAAITYLAAITKAPKNSVFVNFGIAAADWQIGELFTISKITDAATGKNYYPHPVKHNKIKQLPLITIDKPSDNYKKEYAYDMEGAGFYDAALRFSTKELIQVIKVISDNGDNHYTKINKEFVNEIIKKNLQEIIAFISQLSSLQQN